MGATAASVNANDYFRLTRARELKEAAIAIIDLNAPRAARRNFARWFDRAIRSQLEPSKRVARTLSK